MKYIHPLLHWLTAVALHGSIFAVIAAFSFVFLLSDSQVIKDALVDTDIYSDFVPTILDENSAKSRNQPGSLPLYRPEVQAIVNNAFSPSLLRKQTEAAIDDVYKWLNGTKDTITFAYDFTQPKQATIEGIATYAAERLTSLPDCEGAVTEVNVFDVACRPFGFSYEFVRENVLADLQSASFLEDTRITEEDLPKSVNGKRIDEQYSFAPRLFQLLNKSIFPSIGLLLLSAGIFVYVRKPYQRGLKSLGRDLLSNGVMIIVLTIIFGFIIPRYTNTFSIAGDGMSLLFNRVFDHFIQMFNVLVINVALQIAVAGLAILLIFRINSHGRGYANLDVRTGITSSVDQLFNTSSVPSKEIPVQTSENRPKKTSHQKSSKYRKIKL